MGTSSRSSRFRRFIAVGAIGAIAATATVGTLPSGAQQAPDPGTSGEVTDAVADQIAAIEADKADRSPAELKIDSNLLYAAAEAVDGTAVDGAPDLKSSAVVEGGRTEVDITASVDAGLLAQIAGVGGEVKASVPGFDAVRAVVPVASLDELAADDDVRTIVPAGDAMTNQVAKGSGTVASAAPGPVTSSVGAGASQADVTHGADVARASFGVDGTGVKACVLSDGVNTLAARQATGDLPAVDVLPGQAGSGDEGTAMLELIHDIAPGAELGFATAFGSQAGFAQNIIDLRADGCDVIVDDVTYFAEAAFQDDDVARAVSQVKTDGAIYFSSAGNSGNLADGTSGSWQGDFQDIGAAAAPLPAGVRVHGWGVGAANNLMTVGSSQRVTLHWADPLLGSTNDYNLYVLNGAGTTVARASTSAQTGTQDPFEITTASAGERLVVTKAAAAADRYLAVYTNRGRLTTATAGATYGHNASVDTISTAATPAAAAFQAGAPTGPFPGQHSGANLSETFSSDGPSRSFFAPDGTPLTPGVFSSAGGQVRNAIDITAADGVTTTTPGFIPFFGTSAAAPNAAALATLALSFEPALTPDVIEDAMQASATDIEGAGGDVTTGPGITMAPALMSELGFDEAAIVDLDSRAFTPVVGDGDASYEPGEIFDVTQTVHNIGLVDATALSVTLASSSPEVTITSPTDALGTLGAGASADAGPFRIHIAPDCECGQRLDLTATATYSGGLTPSRSEDFTLLVSGGTGTPTTATYAGAPLAIPDNNVTGVSTTLPIGDIGAVGAVTLTIGGSACSTTAGATTVGLDHTWVGDVRMVLTSPSGTSVVLTTGETGNSGNNLCQTVFSDAGATTFASLTAADAPFTGTFRPASPLGAFAGEDAQGSWQLAVSDTEGADTGSLRAFSIEVTPLVCDELVNTAPTANADDYTTPFETPLTVDAPGVLANDSDAELDALTATVVDEPDHGVVALAADGSLTYTPDDSFSGDDTFTYTASDGALSSTETTVTITVGDEPAIRGRVIGPGGAPLAGVAVLAYAPTDVYAPTAWAITEADGTYLFQTLAAGTYSLLFYADPSTGLPQQWRGGPTRATATVMTIVDGGVPISGVDLQMAAAGTISGVALGHNSQPASGVTVRAYVVGSSAYFPSATTTTAVDGSYTLAGLAPGDYQVVFLPTPASGLNSQWYAGDRVRSTANVVTITSGLAVGAIDVQLVLGGSISGHVGAQGVTVMAFSAADTWFPSYQAISAADGSYTLAGVPAGTYRIRFVEAGQPTTWYGGTNRITADDVVLTAGGAVTGIDRTP